MSRMAISEVVDHDHKLSLAIPLEIFITLKVVKIMFTNVLSHKKDSSCYNGDWCQKAVLFMNRSKINGGFLVRFLLSEIHKDSSIEFRRSLIFNFFAWKRCKKLGDRWHSSTSRSWNRPLAYAYHLTLKLKPILFLGTIDKIVGCRFHNFYTASDQFFTNHPFKG